MPKIKVKYKILSDYAKEPYYGSEYSAGADLFAAIGDAITIKAGETAVIPTGIATEIPEGYVGLIHARSSLGIKRGLAPANKVGVIDSDYRGEIKVALFNHGKTDQKIEMGERIAQLLIVPYLTAEFEECGELSDTARGEGGFGSTGKN